MGKLKNYTLQAVEFELYPSMASFARKKGSKDKKKRVSRAIKNIAKLGGATALVGTGALALRTQKGQQLMRSAGSSLQGMKSSAGRAGRQMMSSAGSSLQGLRNRASGVASSVANRFKGGVKKGSTVPGLDGSTRMQKGQGGQMFYMPKKKR